GLLGGLTDPDRASGRWRRHTSPPPCRVYPSSARRVCSSCLPTAARGTLSGTCCSLSTLSTESNTLGEVPPSPDDTPDARHAERSGTRGPSRHLPVVSAGRSAGGPAARHRPQRRDQGQDRQMRIAAPIEIGPLDAEAQQAVRDLAAAAEAHDGVAPLSEQPLLTLGTDAEWITHVVAHTPAGSAVGYVQIDRSGPTASAELVVHPEHRR